MLKLYPFRDVLPSLIAIASLVGSVFYADGLRYELLIVAALFAWMRVWVRTWVGAHTRSKVLAIPELVIDGPFSWSRNPLYLANLGGGVSLLCFLGLPYMWVVSASSLLWLNWHMTILEEEIMLSETFSEYHDYTQNVPRYFGFSLKFGYGKQSPWTAFIEDKWTWIWQVLIICLGIFCDLWLR